MTPSTLPISSLISTCPAPVSDASGVSSALIWNDLVLAWTTTQPIDDVPVRQQLLNDCNLYHPQIIINSTDYGTVNNALMHVRSLLQSCIELYPNT